ncbi:MAG: hypothetical protein Q8J69_07630 [Sphingobacteriaceae bacterium]|nr:hypothetical protein [Sphingobacteriaceae bacterium]
MNTSFLETAPCANIYDVLAVQACKQVRLASTRAKMAKGMQNHLELVTSDSIDLTKGYVICINGAFDRAELWKRNAKGEHTCKLLEMWLQPSMTTQVPAGMLVQNGGLQHA